jgi:DNA-nicking Smr family endonuclease
MVRNYYLTDDIEDTVFAHSVLSYAVPGMPAKKFNELKNGYIPWESRLELRGIKIEEAREALIQFIQMQVQHNKHCVLIIHGEESAKNAPPLLKNLINHWLPQFQEVQAFHSAQAKDEGRDAVYVLLKKETRIDFPDRLPSGARETTFLVAETKAMERRRRLAEQQGERQFAAVKAREHSDVEVQSSPEGELQNNILQHPELDSQRFDGIDPNLNPEPPLNTEARREFDNEKREQDKEKQLRLGNMPKFTTAPTPKGP